MNTLLPSDGPTLTNNTIMFAKRGHPKKLHLKSVGELKNEEKSMGLNNGDCKYVKGGEPAEPATYEICHVTKFGNWEFEGLRHLLRERFSHA